MNSTTELVEETTYSMLLLDAKEREAKGNLVEAIAALTKAVEHSSAPAETNCEIGRLLLDLGQTSDAEIKAIEALKADPQFRQAYMLLGQVLEAQGYQGEAASCYTFVLPKTINKKYFDRFASVIDGSDSASTTRHLAFPAEAAIHLHAPKHISSDCAANFSLPAIKADAAYVDILEQGKIWFDEFNIVVSDKDQRILGDHTIGNNSLIGLAMREHHPQKHKGRVMALVARGSAIYYHWMIDILPGLAALQASGIELSSIDKFLVQGPVNSWHLQTLAHFGIGKKQIIRARHQRFIQADELIVPYFRNRMGSSMGSWVPAFLKHEFGRKIDPDQYDRRRLYLTRADLASRSIANEQQLNSVLTSRGFESIACENLSREEQATLMAQAQVVVAPHGAALTNIIYCRPGTKIIELYGSHISPAYWAISRLCKLDYYNHFCYEDEQSKSPEDSVIHAKTRVIRMAKGYAINPDEILDLLDYAAVH